MCRLILEQSLSGMNNIAACCMQVKVNSTLGHYYPVRHNQIHVTDILRWGLSLHLPRLLLPRVISNTSQSAFQKPNREQAQASNIWRVQVAIVIP